MEVATKFTENLKISDKLIDIRDIEGGITIANNLSHSTNNVRDFIRIKDIKYFLFD